VDAGSALQSGGSLRTEAIVSENGLTVEGRRPSQHLEEEAAEGPQVGRRSTGFPLACSGLM
jgi:hypothetical protein